MREGTRGRGVVEVLSLRDVEEEEVREGTRGRGVVEVREGARGERGDQGERCGGGEGGSKR